MRKLGDDDEAGALIKGGVKNSDEIVGTSKSGADFYVNPSGQAIPSKGYRALGGPAADKAKAENLRDVVD